MAAHKHAALMAQYAQDAAETDKPWERWECNCGNLNTHPTWNVEYEYRRKPKTIMVNGFEVPAPLKLLSMGDVYYSAFTTCATGLVCQLDEIDRFYLTCGVCHSTEDAAIRHREALLRHA